MASFGSSRSGVRPTPSDREQAELIRGLYRNTPVGVAGALFGVIVLCAVLLYIAPERAPWVMAWLAATLASAVWQLVLWVWFRRARPDDAEWRPWARRFVAASLIEGARWGAGAMFLATPGAAEQQLWVIMVIACAASSSVSSLGSYIPAFYALLIPAMAPIALMGWFQPDPRYWAMSLLALVLSLTIAWLGWGQSRSLADALRLRFENLDLAEDLRRQKDVAEQANVAKSQFLAAASHDLRQPIHALGLFIDSLQQERMSPAGLRITGQVRDTVEAMTGLFDSLLDLSQLDAGVVRPQVSSFALEPMLQRICREQTAELRAKPVALRRVSTSAWATSDPILLERMIRNVITNAVRHTQRGRVLVGCRRRGGRILLQVLDTGPGIAPADREKVFQEYVQLGNPERDRTRGLGLGLAITRRLADLLDCPISLASTPGAGSNFALSIPGADAPAGPSTIAEAPVSVSSGLVFVVDDELAVRQSTGELLARWGFEVVDASSGDHLMAQAEPARAPDVVICDWRLRGHETAVDVIARVRDAYGPDIPALLITGDTAPSRLKDAHRTGFALLHKPVAPGKLRAMIGNLIRQRSEAAAGSSS